MEYSDSQNATPLRELTCDIGLHSVVTCHPAEVTFPPLPEPIRLVLDLATLEGRDTRKLKFESCIYQAERPEDGESLDIGQSQFDEAQNDDDDVETVPTISEVRVETKCQNFEHRFSREDRREHLHAEHTPHRLLHSTVRCEATIQFAVAATNRSALGSDELADEMRRVMSTLH